VAFAAAMTLAIGGCAVGTAFRPPMAPGVASYVDPAMPLPGETASAPVAGGEAQRFVPGQEIPAQWWALFRSEALDRWVRQALADSPTLTAAQATLRQAQEIRVARAGGLLPSVDAGAAVSRQQVPGATLGQSGLRTSPFNLYNASVNVSYTFDLFGGTRRELEALQAQVDYQRFQLEGARLALTANVVTTAIQEASLRARIQATQEILALQGQILSTVERQVALGGAARPDLLAQRAQMAQLRTTLPPLEKELAQTRHLLAVLAGRFPAEASGVPEFRLEGLQLPPALPVSLPSSLARQRPDIRAVDELMRAAGARVGVATANLYPQVTLSGSLGTNASRIGDLFGPGTAAWSLGAGLLQPIFRGGALTAERRAAVAVYDQAAAQYRETVLQAFRNVADVLRALEDDAVALAALAEAETSARDSLGLTRKQFELGGASHLALLQAQRRHQEARIGLVLGQAARFADTAALFQALGGGWWNREGEAAIAAKP
jgi:NodT family efflux transporter outer membrane factor (OMF) lipoprotein